MLKGMLNSGCCLFFAHYRVSSIFMIKSKLAWLNEQKNIFKTANFLLDFFKNNFILKIVKNDKSAIKRAISELQNSFQNSYTIGSKRYCF